VTQQWRRKGLAIAFCALVTCGLTACAHDQPRYSIEDGAPNPDRVSRDPDQDQGGDDQARMHASNEDRNNDWGDAVTAPLTDLNLRRQEIPPILKEAVTKPYDLTGLEHCEDIAREVIELDALLGEDFDEPPAPPDQRTNTEKGKDMANHAAVGAMRNAARSIIPFRGLVRQVTGAERHQKEVDTAIQAGKVRRAYLKGVGMNKNCAPPAAPSWFKPRVYVETYVQPQAAPPPPPKPQPKRSSTGRSRSGHR
jgi:hypothetical protein